MSIALSPAVDLPAHGAEPLVVPAFDQVAGSYDGSNVVFRLLRLTSWGPALMNLGDFPFRGPLSFLNAFVNLETTQQRLVRRSVGLLDVRETDRVLDIACGRGKSSFMMHCLHPRASIVGLDLLPENVEVARALFGLAAPLTYTQGNAMRLDHADASFDRVMCLEAAFHFPDRSRFLSEASRVLRPGGRLVVVDFAWTTEAERAQRDDPRTRLVRHIWQWDDIYSIDEYRRTAGQAGLQTLASIDWTSRVTAPFQRLFRFISALGNSRWGRRILVRRNPLFGTLSSDDWKHLALAADAHRHVASHSKYMAFVFAKP